MFRGPAVLLTLALAFSDASACELASLQRPERKPVLPEGTCKVEVDKSWTDQEQFVWERVCLGDEANFNKRESSVSDLSLFNDSSPNSVKSTYSLALTLPDSRILRASFLEQLLINDKYRRALTHRGVRIVGARFTERIDLANAEIAWEIHLDKSIFEKDVNLSRTNSARSIYFDFSRFDEKLRVDSGRIGESLCLRFSAFKDELGLDDVRVASRLDLLGSTVVKELSLGGARIGENLVMRWTSLPKVYLSNARIGGEMFLHAAKVAGPFVAELIDVRLSIYLKQKAEFHDNVYLDFSKMTLLELAGGSFS